MLALLGLGVAGAAPAVAAGAADVGSAAARPLLTIVDGDAVLVQGASRVAAMPGLRLEPRDLLETGERATVVRVEWPDGTVADFGPATRAMIEPGGVGYRETRRPAFYLLQGWAKQGSHGSAPTPGMLTAELEVEPFTGVALAHVDPAAPAAGFVFAESGKLTLGERLRGDPPRPALAAGQVYVPGASGWSVSRRPSSAQLQSVPPGLRQPLPLRAGRLAGKSVAARELPPPRYEELQPWLVAERALRADFAQRFAVLARDAAFRRAVAANLRAHPEWHPVLNPDAGR